MDTRLRKRLPAYAKRAMFALRHGGEGRRGGEMTELDDAKETTRRLGKIGDELITMLVDVSDGALTGKLAEAAVVIGVAEVAAEAWVDRLEMAAQAAEGGE